MAEYICKYLVSKKGMSKEFEIASAATSREEIGNDLYPPAKQKLSEKGIPFSRRAARQIRHSDYNYYDYIIGMDEYNIRNLKSWFGGDPMGKISMLLDRPISDPWYTGDFESTYEDLMEGLQHFLKNISEDHR